jgi:branched-chain amino acid transport system substrate-binding protein
MPVSAAAAPATGAPFTIDVIASATGPAAFFGQQTITAIKNAELALDADGGIAGRPVHFEFHDDESRPQISVQLATQIFATHPAVVLGPTVQATCNAVAALATNGPVVYCLSPGLVPPPKGYVFAASASLYHIVPALFRFLRTSGLTRIALLVTTDATGQRSDQMLTYTLHLPENRGITITAYEHFADSELSVDAQMARIRASAPQAIYISAAGTPFQTVMHGVYDAGLNSVPIITSSANMTTGLLAPWAKDPPQQLVFNGPRFWGTTTDRDRRVQAAIAEYLATYRRSGTEPTPNDDFGWDPCKIVVAAYGKLGTSMTATQLHDYLESLHDFPGIAGVYDFRDGDQHGLGDDSVIIVQWDAAKSIFFPVSGPGGVALRK